MIYKDNEKIPDVEELKHNYNSILTQVNDINDKADNLT